MSPASEPVRTEVVFAAGAVVVAVLSTPAIALALAVVSLVFSLAALARANQAVNQVEGRVESQTRAIIDEGIGDA